MQKSSKGSEMSCNNIWSIMLRAERKQRELCWKDMQKYNKFGNISLVSIRFSLYATRRYGSTIENIDGLDLGPQ